jgi:hypothetical protein
MLFYIQRSTVPLSIRQRQIIKLELMETNGTGSTPGAKKIMRHRIFFTDVIAE